MNDVCSMNNRRRAELRRLREQTRVRDARVEFPDVGPFTGEGPDTEVLVWDAADQVWRPAYLTVDRTVWACVSLDHDFPVTTSPYWLPMPPAPEEKP